MTGNVYAITHPDKGEDVIHVRADVNLHEAHHHPHLLEEELEDNRSTERKVSAKPA